MRVICINNANKPSDYPAEVPWLEKGESYTVIQTLKMANMGNKLAYVLEEIEFPISSLYQAFSIERFRPETEDDKLAEAAVEELLEEIFEEQLI